MNIEKLKSKLKAQRNIGVNRNGTLTTQDPRNDGSQERKGTTTLKPKAFYHK